MSNKSIRPSTLDGIKRLAKSIKKEQGIKHLRALEVAAQLAGFHNIKHAHNVLHERTKQHSKSLPAGHRIFLTAYWRDKESATSGRETLSLQLSVPWFDLITPAQLTIHRALLRFHSEGPDHLARRDMVQTQSRARQVICAAARTLQFMDVTKLRPSKGYSRALPGGRWSNVVPGCDHYSIWYDPQTRRYLFADEPYELKAERYAAERAAWAERHGNIIAKPSWAGMYNPNGGSRLYLIADSEKGIPLAPVVAALDRLPAPIVEDTWNGESAPSIPIFVSPGAIAKNEAAQIKREKPQSVRIGPRNTLGYVQTFIGPQRRPKGKMPIESHKRVGELLKSVLVASYRRKGVYNRLDSVRSELEEWVQREYCHEELPNEEFFDLYYHEDQYSYARTLSVEDRRKHMNGLDAVKQTLAQHYPDCPPLRDIFKKVDAAIKSLQSWER